MPTTSVSVTLPVLWEKISNKRTYKLERVRVYDSGAKARKQTAHIWIWRVETEREGHSSKPHPRWRIYSNEVILSIFPKLVCQLGTKYSTGAFSFKPLDIRQEFRCRHSLMWSSQWTSEVGQCTLSGKLRELDRCWRDFSLASWSNLHLSRKIWPSFSGTCFNWDDWLG